MKRRWLVRGVIVVGCSLLVLSLTGCDGGILGGHAPSLPSPEEPAALDVTTVGQAGEPLPFVTVNAVYSSGETREFQTDGDGHLYVPMDELPELLVLTKDGHQTVITEVDPEFATLATVPILDGSPPRDCPTITSDAPDVNEAESTAEVTGTVTGSDSRMLGVIFNGVPSTRSLPGDPLTAERAYAMTLDLIAGVNVLEIIAGSSSCKQGYSRERIEIPFQPDEEPPPPPPPADCVIEGVVRDAEGDALPAVTVRRADKDDVTVTNENGEFCFDQLPDGQHLLIFQLEDFGTEMHTVRVGADEEPLEVILPEAPVDLPTERPAVQLDAPQIDRQSHTAQVSGTATNMGGGWIGWIHNGLAFAERFPLQPPLTSPQPFSFTIDLLDGLNDVTVFAANPSLTGSQTTGQFNYDPGTADLSGFITDGYGFPINSRITLYDGQNSYEETTGTHGQYRYFGLPAARFGMAAVGPGWASRYLIVDRGDGAPATRDVQLSEMVDNTALPCAEITVEGSDVVNGEAIVTGTVTNSDSREILFFQDRVPRIGQVDGAPEPTIARTFTATMDADDGTEVILFSPGYACLTTQFEVHEGAW